MITGINFPTDIVEIPENRCVFGIKPHLTRNHTGKITYISAVQNVSDRFGILKSFDQKTVRLFFG